MKKPYTIIVTILLIIVSGVIKAQCLVLNIPLENRVEQSTIVIEGKVISTNAYWNEKRDYIYTSNIIEVYKIFKGELSASTIELITEGGMVDDIWMKIEPGLSLNVGEIGVFICDNNLNSNRNVSSYKPNLASLGFIKYDMDELSASDLYTRYNNIESNLYAVLNQTTGNQIKDLGKFDLSLYKKLQSANRSLQAAPVITSFSPSTVSAGSKTLLTINGSGFGATRGSNAVGFYDANNGGSTWVDVNDNGTTADDLFYVSWSDTKIEVYVPARNGSSNYFAGTGKISVKVGGSRGVSTGTLYVKWARYEAQSIDGPVPAILANINGAGGYTWRMGTSFAANSAAAGAFARAVTTLSCETGINWNIGANTTITTNADDGINVIRYSNSGELGNGILAATATTYRLFCGSGSTRRWYLLGFDMAVNTTPLSGYTWQNGPGAPTSWQYDLETVLVHELGHAMQLGHIIKPGFIMNYSISNGESTRTIHPELSEGGNAITLSSFAVPTCTGPSPDGGAMIKFIPSSCATGISSNDQKSIEVEVYPNPARNVLIINSEGKSIQHVMIYDQLGREIYNELNMNANTNTLHSINTEYFPDGIYFVKIIADEKIYNQKVVVSH